MDQEHGKMAVFRKLIGYGDIESALTEHAAEACRALWGGG